jgi:hypothetical protein
MSRMSPDFPPHIKHALDQYDVPPLPAGFADRLLARVASDDTGDVQAKPYLAKRWLQNRNARRAGAWGRSGRILTTVAVFSLASATAAAAGFFGEPTYIPGISQMLASAKLIVDPRKIANSQSAKTAPAVAPVVKVMDDDTHTVPVKAKGGALVIARMHALQTDPAFTALPPLERLIVARRAVFAMVRSGEATPQEARDAIHMLAKDADPAKKALWSAEAQARQESREARRQAIKASRPQDTETIDASGLPQTAPPANTGTLRERLRNATPEQRAAIREAVRQRRQDHVQAEGQ